MAGVESVGEKMVEGLAALSLSLSSPRGTGSSSGTDHGDESTLGGACAVVQGPAGAGAADPSEVGSLIALAWPGAARSGPSDESVAVVAVAADQGPGSECVEHWGHQVLPSDRLLFHRDHQWLAATSSTTTG